VIICTVYVLRSLYYYSVVVVTVL